MGIDILDFMFRMEKRFGIKISREESHALQPLWMTRKPPDLTAGELHDWIVKLCEARGVTVPYSSWNRVKLELAKLLRKPPKIIHRETLVVRDLGFS